VDTSAAGPSGRVTVEAGPRAVDAPVLPLRAVPPDCEPVPVLDGEEEGDELLEQESAKRVKTLSTAIENHVPHRRCKKSGS